MMAAQPPAEAEVFAKHIMSTYGRYPITMVKCVGAARVLGGWLVGFHVCTSHYTSALILNPPITRSLARIQTDQPPRQQGQGVHVVGLDGEGVPGLCGRHLHLLPRTRRREADQVRLFCQEVGWVGEGGDRFVGGELNG
jgi:hypothetical protein